MMLIVKLIVNLFKLKLFQDTSFSYIFFHLHIDKIILFER